MSRRKIWIYFPESRAVTKAVTTAALLSALAVLGALYAKSLHFFCIGATKIFLVYDLSKRLIKDGHDVTVVTYKEGDAPDFENDKGVKVYRVPNFDK